MLATNAVLLAIELKRVKAHCGRGKPAIGFLAISFLKCEFSVAARSLLEGASSNAAECDSIRFDATL